MAPMNWPALQTPILFFLLSSHLPYVTSNGEEAVVVYSRDTSCRGQEMIRAYSNECKQYYANDDATIDYFRFHCNKNTNTLVMKQYIDQHCTQQVNDANITILMQIESNEVGTCQRFNPNELSSSYHSAQLFCGGISSINNPKTFFNAFETEKVMFRHYSNSDDTCASKPSVIELFAQRTCLYFPAIDSSVHTGVYSMFAKEVSEGTANEKSRISAQFFNNNQCRREGAVIGPPGDGEIGHPIRTRLRALQMIGPPMEGGIGGPDMGMPGGPESGPDDGPHEPGPGHWSPPEGDASEIMDLDDREDLCVSSAAALLGPTTLDASITAFSTVTLGTYFDFVTNSIDGNSFDPSQFTTSSPSDDTKTNSKSHALSLVDEIFGLVIWAFGGLAFGLTIFFVYASLTGTDLFPNLVKSYPTSRANTFISEAENDTLTESKHSTHGLLHQDSQL